MIKEEQEYHPAWLEFFPKVLKERHLICIHETNKSAIALREKYEHFADGKQLSHDVEKYLFDSFIADDYDGRLHLTTIHRLDENIDISAELIASGGYKGKGIGEITGLVFWRELDDDEMKHWFHWDYISRLHHARRYSQTDLSSSERAAKALKLTRTSSIESLSKFASDSKLEEDLSHAWVKIELVAVRQEFWGHHLGTLLMSCCLYHAYLNHNSRAILHVAGGGFNVPAIKLYEKFGFLGVNTDTMFDKPDRDLYILGDIKSSLEELAWDETL
jgi:GNAT superfamily N-acetyltransferase